MRPNKLALFTTLLPLSLTACNTQSIAGTYYFQLGKETGTHFGIYLYLTDKEYIPAEGDSPLDDEKFKCFTLNGSANFPQEEGAQDMGEIINIFFESFPEGIPGYYRRSGKNNHQGEEILKVGFSFSHIMEMIAEAAEKQGEEIVIPDDIDKLNDSKLIQSLLYVTYKQEAVNIYIPVSIDDVYYQLYWFGIDVKFKPMSLEFELVDVTPHELGSHPTKEEVEEINLTFEQEHEGCYFTSFRDYNNLKMGLTKR